MIADDEKASPLELMRLAFNIGSDLIALISVIVAQQHAISSIEKIATILMTEGHCPQSVPEGMECYIYYEYTMNLLRFGMADPSEDYFASCIHSSQDDLPYYYYMENVRNCEKIPYNFRPFDTCNVTAGDFDHFVAEIAFNWVLAVSSIFTALRWMSILVLLQVLCKNGLSSYIKVLIPFQLFASIILNIFSIIIYSFFYTSISNEVSNLFEDHQVMTCTDKFSFIIDDIKNAKQDALIALISMCADYGVIILTCLIRRLECLAGVSDAGKFGYSATTLNP